MNRRARGLLSVIIAAVLLGSCTSTSTSASTRWQPRPSAHLQLDLAGTPTATQRHGPFRAIEVDGFDTSTSVVAQLHHQGLHVVCYVDAGTWENWRPDAAHFPRSVLGKPDAGWAGERWLDIRRLAILLPLMRARIAMCHRKGFDAVDPDNVDGVENDTGFPLTMAEQLSYDRAIAAIAHHDHLSVALKSFAEGANALEPNFDFVVEEQCVQFSECTLLRSFVRHHKAVFDIEYTTTLSFCALLPPGIVGVAKNLSLDAWARWCPSRSSSARTGPLP